jgi:hypothetical protein
VPPLDNGKPCFLDPRGPRKELNCFAAGLTCDATLRSQRRQLDEPIIEQIIGKRRLPRSAEPALLLPPLDTFLVCHFVSLSEAAA